ncbi:MAG: TIGR02147 family protein [Chitinivibrionales bacterium]
MDNIFTYSDYRAYIHDYYTFMKSTRPSFSYRAISERAGINSSGFYPLIVQGKRDLTPATIEKTARALELDAKEAEYFGLLVRFNQARTLRKKNEYFQKLVEVLNRKNVEVISETQYDIFSEWYHGVIRELVVCREFNEDFKKLGRMLRPEITAKQARQSVELLLRLGFLKKEDGTYVQSSPIITTGPDVKAHQILNYQVKMLKLAREAFDRFGPNELLSNSSTTFRISRQTYELFKQKNRAHRQELLKLAEADRDSDMVFQLNINMFPLVNPRTRGKKDD